MNENGHITKENFIAFQSDLLKQSEKEKFLEHISTCDFCADQFTAFMSEDIIAAPRDMKANILRATMRPEIQMAIKVRETSKRLQLFIYSLKVCTVTVCALLLMLLTMNNQSMSGFLNTSGNITAEATGNEDINKSLATTIKYGVDKIGSSIMDFSSNFIKKEVTDNDQKKK